MAGRECASFAAAMDAVVAARLLELASRTAHSEEERAELRAVVGSCSREIAVAVSRALGARQRELARAGYSADDLAQHVLAQLLDGRMPDGVESRSPVAMVMGWAIRVAKNKLMDDLRSARVRTTTSSDDADGPSLVERTDGGSRSDSRHEGRSLAIVVDRCADELAPKRRKLWIALVEDPDASVPELAHALDYPREGGAVSTQVRNAIFALRHETKLAMAKCIEANAGVKLWAPRAKAPRERVEERP